MAGIVTMLLAIDVRAWACYEPLLAGAVTLIFAASGAVITFSNRETALSFERIRLLDAQPKSLRASFAEADANGDGRLSAGEIALALKRCGVPMGQQAVSELMSQCCEPGYDADETVSLGYDGFARLVALLKEKGMTTQRDDCELMEDGEPPL